MRSPKTYDVEVQICENKAEALIRFSIDVHRDEGWESSRINEIRLIGNDDYEWINDNTPIISEESIRITFSKTFSMSDDEIQKASFDIASLPAEPHLENLVLIIPVSVAGSKKKFQLIRNHVFQPFRWVEIKE